MKDRRLPPFVWQARAATAAIRENFTGKERNTALGIYQAMTEAANDQRDHRFQMTRKALADLAGVTPPTLDKYATELAKLGLLAWENRFEDGHQAPNLWVLKDLWSEPEESEPHPAGQRQANGAQQGQANRTPKETVQAELLQALEDPTCSPPHGDRDPMEAEWQAWQDHHHAVTGYKRLRPGTKIHDVVRAMYVARREEDYTAADLRAAVDGAFSDAYRREHGYYDQESVLRPTKVHKLVEQGKARANGQLRSASGSRNGTGISMGDREAAIRSMARSPEDQAAALRAEAIYNAARAVVRGPESVPFDPDDPFGPEMTKAEGRAKLADLGLDADAVAAAWRPVPQGERVAWAATVTTTTTARST